MQARHSDILQYTDNISCVCRDKDKKSRHKSRSKERASSHRRRHKSEVTDSSEDEFGGYVPRKRQEAPRASKIKPVAATREPFRKRGCAAQAYIITLCPAPVHG